MSLNDNIIKTHFSINQVHYGSRTAPASESNTPENTLQTGVAPPPADMDSIPINLTTTKDAGGGCLKKANLYAWISLQKLFEVRV